MKRLIATTVFLGALALLLAMTAQAAVAQDIEIKSVDNYAGNSNVYTNRPNTTVTITHADGEHWTGTTDSAGKITINAGYTLSKEYLKIKLASGNQSNMVEGFVVPDNVYGGQPFSFAVPQSAGTNINVQTVSGVVVQASADKYGRVFVARGWHEGLYQITAATIDGQAARELGKIEIKHRPSDALERPWEHPPKPMQLQNQLQAVNLADPTLEGKGFSPNSATTQVNVTSAGQTQAWQVSAAKNDQLKLARTSQLRPGLAELTVTNQATGETTGPVAVVLFNAGAHLDRDKLKSKEQTTFAVEIEPQDVPMKVWAEILGQATFSGGGTEAEAVTNHGRAVFPVSAKQGSGPFHVNWRVEPLPAQSAQLNSSQQARPQSGSEKVSLPVPVLAAVPGLVATGVIDASHDAHSTVAQDKGDNQGKQEGLKGNDWDKILATVRTFWCAATRAAQAADDAAKATKDDPDFNKKKAKAAADKAAKEAKQNAQKESENVSDSALRGLQQQAADAGQKAGEEARDAEGAAKVLEDKDKQKADEQRRIAETKRAEQAHQVKKAGMIYDERERREKEGKK